MKKLICIFMIAAMLFTLTACRRAEPEPEPEPEPPFDWDNFVLYTTFARTHEENNIRISYPQIDGLRDTEIQSRINSVIQAWALEILEDYDEETRGELALEVEYEVTRTGDSLMSTVFRGTAFIEGMPYVSKIFYTVNVDIVVGVEVALVDMVTLGDEFIAIFREHATTELAEADEYIKANTDEALHAMLRSSDMFGESGVFSYYTDDAVVISFYVPNAIGGHAEFTLSFDILEGLLHEMRL
jgi:hypothetical protein